MKRLSIIIILCLATLLPAKNAIAQSVRNLTISPPTVSISANPGEAKEGKIKIINDSNETLSFIVDTQDYIVVDTVGTPNILPENTLNNKYSAAAWLGVSPNKFTVEPGQKQELGYYMQIPADAKPGGHYAAIVFKPDVVKGEQSVGTTVSSQIGTLFYINVPGAIKEDASILSFLTNWFNEYGPVNLKTQIENLGDLHIAPQGKISVTNIFGQKVETQDLPNHNIFPEATRDYENTVGKKWMFGPYKATLLASYGVNNNLPLSSTVTFWVIPWKIILLIILAVTAVALGVIYTKKRKKKAKLAELSQAHQD